MTQVVIGTGRPIAMRTPSGFTNITARPLSAEQLANFLRHPDIAALVPDTDGDGEIADVQIGRRRAVAQVRKKGHELILSLTRSENATPAPGTQPLARVATPKPDVAAPAPRAKSPTGSRATASTGGRAKSPTGARTKSPSTAPRTKSPTKIPRTKGSTYTPIATFKEGAKPPAPSALDIPTSRLPAGLTFGGAGAPTTSSPAANDVGSFSLDDASLELGSAAPVPAPPSAPERGPDLALDLDALDLGRPGGAGALELDSPMAAARAATVDAGRVTAGGSAAIASRAATVDARGALGAGSASSARRSLELDDDVGFGATVARPAGSLGLDDDVGFGATVARPGSLALDDDAGFGATVARPAGSLALDDDVGFGATVARPAGSLTLDDDVGFGATVARPAGGLSLDLDDDHAYGHASKGGASLDLGDQSASAQARDRSSRDHDAGSRAPATRPGIVSSSTSFVKRAPGSPVPSTTRFAAPVAGAPRAPAPPIGVVPPAGSRASSPAISVPAIAPPAGGGAPAAARIASGTPARADCGAFGAILRAARERGASDLHVSAARVTAIRVGGELVPLEPGAAPMSAAAVSDMLLPLLDDASAAQLETVGYIDLALEAPGGGRLRANISRQQQGLKGTFRLALAAPASLEQLGLPADLAKVVHHHQGLIVVAGPSGHGKTTTLAAFVDLLNSTKAFHILTIEDPVEIVHTRKQAVISQRETGRHTTSFARGLKASLREDPDVIVIGELRDRESVEIALTAAETGHLVIATMSTPSAAKTIDRLIDMFPPEEHSQVRASIAGALRAIVAQRLLPRRGGGVVPAVELVTGVLPLAVLIRDDKLYQLPNLLQRGRAFGMIRMDESLAELVRAGKVDEETALAFAESKKDLAAQLRPAPAQAAAPPQAKTSPLWGFGKKDPR